MRDEIAPIYCDNHVAVFSKPNGYLTQPTTAGTPDLQTLARLWVKEKYQKAGNAFLEPIHRLDRPVSGMVLFARTSKALTRLQESMRNREIGKKYFALVEGKVKKETGTLVDYLEHGHMTAHIVSSKHENGKRAELEYRVVDQRKNVALLEVTLHTGRYHQIRAQLSHMGHPIVGDEKYGSTYKTPPHTIALHHAYLTFIHPVTKETITFDDPYPRTLFATSG